MRPCDRPRSPLRPSRFLLTTCILTLLLGGGSARPLDVLVDLPDPPSPKVPRIVGQMAQSVRGMCGGTGEDSSPARYVIGFHDMPRSLRKGQDFALDDGRSLGRIVRIDHVLRFVVVETNDAARLVDCVREDPNVSWLEPEILERILDDGDPLASDPGSYGPGLVGARDAWRATPGSDEVVACVADTGVRSTHEDLAGPRDRGGIDVLLDQPYAWDTHGHGTHVTGILAATTQNGKGVAGMAQVSFVHAKVIQPGGIGFADVIASGIRWCVEQGADVVSLSLGGEPARALQEAVDYAWAKGAIVVAAAGNEEPEDCDERDCVAFPAAYPRALAVGCVDRKARPCLGSSQGPQVALAAPGQSILSLSHQEDDGYVLMTGTSMATPVVAGAAALLKSAHPEWDNFQIRTALERTARDLDEKGFDRRTGHGLVRVDRALRFDPGSPERPGAAFTFNASQLTLRADASPSTRADASTSYFLWEWGDGSTGTGRQARHAYAEPGTYDVTLTVVDARGASARTTLAVAVAGRACSSTATDACGAGGPEPGSPSGATSRPKEYRSDPVECSRHAAPSPDGAVGLKCEVTKPYAAFDEPDSLEVRADARGASCGSGAPLATVEYQHESQEPVEAAAPPPCVGAAPSLATPASPAEAPSAPLDARAPDAAGEAQARFHRPVDDEGQLSEDFQERPIESADASVTGPVSTKVGLAPFLAKDASPFRSDRLAERAAPDEDASFVARAAHRPAGLAPEAGVPMLPSAAASPALAPGSSWRGEVFRSALAGASGVDADAAAPALASVAMVVALAAAALYHRITGARVAEHPRRAAILRELDATPGLTATELASRMGLHPTSVAHHLRRMHDAGVVTAQAMGRRTRYVRALGTTTPSDVARSVLLRVPLAREILALAGSRPGVTIGEAAGAVGVSRFAVRLQVERLREAQLVVVRQDGTARRIFLPEA